jgi:hypothetical protein
MRPEITFSLPLVCHAQTVTGSCLVVSFSVSKLFVFQTKASYILDVNYGLSDYTSHLEFPGFFKSVWGFITTRRDA